jgi:hypothetical protein
MHLETSTAITTSSSTSDRHSELSELPVEIFRGGIIALFGCIAITTEDRVLLLEDLSLGPRPRPRQLILEGKRRVVDPIGRAYAAFVSLIDPYKASLTVIVF